MGGIKGKIIRAGLGMALGIVAFGCKAGGDLTVIPPIPAAPAPLVNVPTITSPMTTPYYSNANALIVTGMCMEGETVILTGDSSDTQTCVASTYSFTVGKAVDGVYSFVIYQVDSLMKVSSPASLIWVRKSSVSAPVLLSPASNPYFSTDSSITIAGTCENGDTISLSGGGAGSTTCVSSTFSMNLPKAVDGDYSIVVTQTDLAGNTASANLLWKKHVLSVTPSNPTLVVNTSQTFTPAGGSQSYTLSFVTNNSGGSISGLTYTAGTLANVTDTLKLTDSLGEFITFTASTAVGAADHFVVVAGDSLTQSIGTVLGTHPKVQIVDRFGNGVPGQQVYFQMINGDARLASSSIQTSDSQGNVSVSVQLGYAALTDTLFVGPFSGTLPDLAGSGHATLLLTEHATTLGSGAFGTTYPVGSSPGQTLLVDLDGDGKLDAIVLNVGSSNVGVLMGKGGGIFGTMQHYSTCSGPSGVATGDFNGDGKIDIAVICSGSDNFSILLGVGDGTFLNAHTYTTDPWVSMPAGLVVGDFDGDGKMDIAMVGTLSDNAAVVFGNGDGTFTAPYTFATGHSPTAIATADLNKDGAPDLIATNGADNTISTLINTKQGSSHRATTFGAKTDYAAGQNPIALAVGDFDGNGWTDVIVANAADNTVSLFTNMSDGTGALDAQQAVSVGGSPSALAVGDFDGDGRLDIAVTNASDSTVGILLGLDPLLGQGPFSNMTAFSSGSSPEGLAVADLNGDGHLDVVVSCSGDNDLQFFPSDGLGNLGFINQVGVGPVGAASADFNGDGKEDLAVVNTGSNTVRVLKGVGNGLFTTMATLTTQSAPSSIVTGDFDGDGNADIAVTNSGAGTVSVFFGKGDGTFQPRVDIPVGLVPTSIQAGDFNRDGKMDLVVVNSNSNTVSVLLGNGSARTFQPKVDYAVGGNPQAVAVADFNGDRLLDLAVTNASDNTVSVLLGNGNGTFQTQVVYGTGTTPTSVLAGDLNGDGVLDLIVLNSVDGSISTLLGNGDGSFKAHHDYPAGSTPVGMVMGDFNGDGNLDIVVTNGAATGYTVLLGPGNGGFPTMTSYSGMETLSGLASGDFNGDGKVDFVILDSTNDAVEVWLGR